MIEIPINRHGKNCNDNNNNNNNNNHHHDNGKYTNTMMMVIMIEVISIIRVIIKTMIIHASDKGKPQSKYRKNKTEDVASKKKKPH